MDLQTAKQYVLDALEHHAQSGSASVDLAMVREQVGSYLRDSGRSGADNEIGQLMQHEHMLKEAVWKLALEGVLMPSGQNWIFNYTSDGQDRARRSL